MISKFAVITFYEAGEPVRPDQGLPGQPVYPSTGPIFGGGGHPSQPIHLPPPGHIATLPVFPFDPTRPDQGLPGEGGGHPSHPIVPGARFIVKWLACSGLILVPDNSLPETPEPK